MSVKVIYSDSFKKKVEAQFNGNVKIIKSLHDGSPLLGDLMTDESSAINDLALDWAKVEMHRHFSEKQS